MTISSNCSSRAHSAVPGMVPRALHTLDQCSSAALHPSPLLPPQAEEKVPGGQQKTMKQLLCAKLGRRGRPAQSGGEPRIPGYSLGSLDFVYHISRLHNVLTFKWQNT
ncbi:hypothetical protein H1C71_014891 [Ictidomys tridecemlineatus]|nr:hypothetical protein H1C71_014891 [Ictidomys tridecemlineatus]